MQEYIDRFGPERLWLAVVGIITITVALGAVLFPESIYRDFLWKYYWGPVVADAHNWGCVAWAGGEQIPCAEAGADAGPTASPGYTFVSYAGYIPTLIILLIGVLFLIRRLDIERYRAGFYALFPFMLFGGALRTVEDANVAAPELIIPFPWSALIISPFIYGTVFLVVVAALVFSVWLDRNNYVSSYEYPLAAIGTLALLVTVGYLVYLAMTEEWASLYPWITIVTLVGATAITGATWLAIDRFAPEINQGTLYMGLVVIWAHSVDGVANVIGLDWATAFGLPANLVPKHPINEAIVTYTGAWLPESVTAVTGQAWPFLIVKVVAAVLVIWLFDEEIFEESPRYAILLMITVVAVGLGPGTRDMLRATFGI